MQNRNTIVHVHAGEAPGTCPARRPTSGSDRGWLIRGRKRSGRAGSSAVAGPTQWEECDRPSTGPSGPVVNNSRRAESDSRLRDMKLGMLASHHRTSGGQNQERIIRMDGSNGSTKNRIAAMKVDHFRSDPFCSVTPTDPFPCSSLQARGSSRDASRISGPPLRWPVLDPLLDVLSQIIVSEFAIRS